MYKSVYLEPLKKLGELMNGYPQSHFYNYARVVSMVTLNMRYEKVAFNSELEQHPYILTANIINDVMILFRSFCDIAFIEDKSPKVLGTKSQFKEDKHQELFNDIWDKYNSEEYGSYVDRYINRIQMNELGKIIKGKDCVDLGCGSGVFCFALLHEGARKCVGIDYGEHSIAYASRVAEAKGISTQTEFNTATVYETGLADNQFDFAVQNGVFHHLDDEDRALLETSRILKNGGWFWYYTEGEGGISYDLWDFSVDMLKEVPVIFIREILETMNVSRNKIAHLSDGLSATYAHTSWEKATQKLARHGFSNFKRLVGGFSTDFDHDRIESDPYGKEKFGEGDLRILCQLVKE